MLSPRPARERACTKSPPYTGPVGHPGPNTETAIPASTSVRRIASRPASREPTNTSASRRPGRSERGGAQELRVAPEREVVGTRPGTTMAFEARAVVREEAVVGGPQDERHAEPVGVVGEPVDPPAAAPALQVRHIRRLELRPLEDEHQVRRRAL